jgi:hypothetical protein
MNRIDLTGTKFLRITVLAPDASRISASGRSETMWKCVCDCGKEFSAPTGIIRNGHKKSCGCLLVESRVKSNTRHGFYGTRTYVSWNAMITRCTNKSNPNYARYGAKGIRVCDHWLIFENFLSDMGERPVGKTLDRFPDSKGNYEPGNCRWATVKQQCENRKSTRWIEHDGVRLSVSEWARKLGINQSTLNESLNKNPIHHALRPRKTTGAIASY